MTLWHDTCTHDRHRRRRMAACHEHANVRRGCSRAVAYEPASPRRRYFVEGPLDAAYVLLEERREQLFNLSPR
jgi:hypothetical protein